MPAITVTVTVGTWAWSIGSRELLAYVLAGAVALALSASVSAFLAWWDRR